MSGLADSGQKDIALHKGNPNQQLAAIWIRNCFADLQKVLWNTDDRYEVLEAMNNAKDQLTQFDNIMGDELRTIANEEKMPNPFV